MIRFGPENIYRDPVTAMAVVGIGASAGGSIFSGISADKAAKEEAKLIRRQGGIALEESQKEAEIEAYNQRQAIGRQKLAFLANGVTLEGSPMLVIKENRKFGQESVDAILKRGVEEKELADKRADQTKKAGRAALISGGLGAVGSIFSGVSGLNKTSLNPSK